MLPVIGITGYAKFDAEGANALFGVRQSYVRAVAAAGGVAIILPPQPAPASLDVLLSIVDGLIFTGGEDLDPASYGEAPHPAAERPDPERDAAELALVRQALDRQIPFLGICRGLQVINVAMGGSLFQDLPDQYRGETPHPNGSWQALPHAINIAPDSRLARILGATQHQVNSLHHQGIKTPGQRVRIVARAEDGLPEGIEIEGHPAALAVQFHPEALFLNDPRSFAIFQDLIAQAQAYQRSRGVLTSTH